MKLSSLIPEHLVIFGDSAKTKPEVIDILLERVCAGGGACLDLSEVRASVLARESKTGTTYPTGVAIPHGRIEGLDDCIVSVYVPRGSVTDGGQAVRMVFLILTSTHGSSLYLKTLAAIAKLSKDAGLMDTLTSAGSPAHFLDALEKARVEVDRPPTVGDLMAPAPPGLPPGTTVRELIDLFHAKGIRWAHVTGTAGEFLGEISLFEVMARAMPNYSTYMENLSFMPAFRPLETLLEKESEITVGMLAVKPPTLLDPGTSVIEAAFELLRHHRGSAPVLEGGRLVGILGLADVLLGYMRG